MEFSNPFDNPQGQFLFCKMRSSSSACGHSRAHYRKAGA
jgi:hypothetical protein